MKWQDGYVVEVFHKNIKNKDNNGIGKIKIYENKVDVEIIATLNCKNIGEIYPIEDCVICKIITR